MTIRLRAERCRIFFYTSVLLLAGFALSGCGGHHSSSSNNNVSLTAVIHWPALTTGTRQAASGVSTTSTAAIVCIITTTSGNTGNGDPIDFTPIVRDPSKAAVNSDGSLPAYTDAFDQPWNSNTVIQNPQQVRSGANNIQVSFYAQNPTGTTSGVNNDLIPSSYALLPAVAGSGLIPIVIPTTANGSTFPIGTYNATTATLTGSITTTNSIRSVLISPITVSYGNAGLIPVTAYDSNGNAVAPSLQTGAANFDAGSSGIPSIAPNGTVTANGLGTTTTFATVDGIKSNTVTITSYVGGTSGYTSRGEIFYLDAAYSVIPAPASPAVAGSSISITYVGYFSNDPTNVNSVSFTAFDTVNQTNPITVTVGSNSLITGLDAGLSGMSVGTQRIIVVPPDLGYGASQVGTVPASSTLYYIVTRTQ